ncbi:hypothetical protein J2847_005879 [Azospirillum agricola]|uniref:hypothetical protein n=1 Tax=Azospirillum agricola TaxID=1720247 RepID=UPI001AE5FE27|nr:hypothetical protein [Azospirillum agricola]MBP2232550.1 hypothetical protein [Azospirillum agricola]
MGWGYGTNSEGREVGYTVEATCDFPGCEAKIDRGLGYACGGMHDRSDDPGDGPRCGGYFCAEHRYTHTRGPDGDACRANDDAEEDEAE